MAPSTDKNSSRLRPAWANWPARDQPLEVLLLGGGVMVFVVGTRNATHDLDVVLLSPAERAPVRELAAVVVQEKPWPAEWLNDAAKGLLIGPADGPIIFDSMGIVVRRPSIEQFLATKLCAWRDDADVEDASRLLKELHGTRVEVWERVKPFLLPERELKTTTLLTTCRKIHMATPEK